MVSSGNDYVDLGVCSPPKPFPSNRLRNTPARPGSARVQTVRASTPSAEVTQQTARPSLIPSRKASRELPIQSNVGTINRAGHETKHVLIVKVDGSYDDACTSELRAPYAPTGVDMTDLTWGGMQRRRLTVAE